MIIFFSCSPGRIVSAPRRTGWRRRWRSRGWEGQRSICSRGGTSSYLSTALSLQSRNTSVMGHIPVNNNSEVSTSNFTEVEAAVRMAVAMSSRSPDSRTELSQTNNTITITLSSDKISSVGHRRRLLLDSCPPDWLTLARPGHTVSRSWALQTEPLVTSCRQLSSPISYRGNNQAANKNPQCSSRAAICGEK